MEPTVLQTVTVSVFSECTGNLNNKIFFILKYVYNTVKIWLVIPLLKVKNVEKKKCFFFKTVF